MPTTLLAVIATKGSAIAPTAFLRSDLPTRKALTQPLLLNVSSGQPVITAKEAARQLQVTFPAANDAIAELVEMDILRLSNAQRRNRAF